MSNGNPFYVAPAQVDVSSAMQGFGSLISENREQRRKEQLKQGLMQAYQSGDPDQVAEFSAANPESSAVLGQMLNFRNEMTAKNYDDSLKNFLSNPTRETLVPMMEERMGVVRGQGGDPFDTEQAVAAFETDPDSFIRRAEMALATREPKAYEAYKDQRGIGDRADIKVQSSELLPGGGARMVMSDGSVMVKRPDESDEDFIRKAEKYGAKLQGTRASAREGGKNAQKAAMKAFDQTNKIRKNVRNLQKVVDLVGEGAETGPIANKLPSFRSASLRLDQIKNELGLDVVGAVTFGALSEGELDLALNTALPTGLEGPELVQWAKDKIAAQNKLADYFEEQAIFLGREGNTIPDFIDMKSEMAIPTQPTTQEGATATNPATGQRIIFQNGQWQPAP